ncbi:MAG: type IV pilin N-terminal domain-containing protein [Methanocorpusculum sp.]|nr:type IV pilin N-terminal domain-containing protein [Methanocorpusculum sp.]
MTVRTKKNDGVSPVIGTILLVAITVVLVAIISAVVMGMTGGIGTSHVVGVKVVQGADLPGTDFPTLLVTITGGDTTGLGDIFVYNGSDMIRGVSFSTAGVGVPMSFYDGGVNLNSGLASLSIVGRFPDGAQTIYTGTINLV